MTYKEIKICLDRPKVRGDKKAMQIHGLCLSSKGFIVLYKQYNGNF